MSELDKHFADKLNEEAQFPLREKSWKALSARLDAAGGVLAAGSTLLLWKALSAGLFMISGVLLFQVYTIREDMGRMTDRVEGLEDLLEQIHASATAYAGTGPEEYKEHADLTGNATVNREEARTGHQSRATAPGLLVQHPVFSRPVLPPGYWAPATADPAEADGVTTASDQRGQGSSAPLEQTETPFIASLAKPDRVVPQKQPVHFVSAGEDGDRRNTRGRVHRIGVQWGIGDMVPKVDGISSSAGAGVTVAYSPFRNIWLTASADWLKFSVRTTGPPPASIVASDIKTGSNPFYDLTSVIGDPHQMHLSLGVGYTIPVAFRIKPTFRIAHSWVKTTPGVFSYNYDPKDPHPHWKSPYQVAITPDEKVQDKVWRFGIGMEYETRNWVFRTGADWIEGSMTDTPYFDAWLWQMGLLYKL
ncbi:MAG: hypothetical protein EP344_13375 [Bacteroidetes bacterium]|nr:MAG: hypothetical protein EP344_13375 [Bacteroidota bacterium]